MEIKNAIIAITGAASGIGQAAALELAALGARVVLGDVNIEALQIVQNKILEAGGTVEIHPLDVTNEVSVQSFMDAAINHFGQIDAVIASAGIIRDSYLVTPDKTTGKVKKFMQIEQWKQVIDVNLTGVFLTIREAAIRMVNQGNKGVLIPISSINKSGELGQLNYASTKAAIALWPKIIAGEFHARNINNIRIASIAPGYVATPLLLDIKPEILAGIIKDIPTGRLVNTSEIVSTIEFILKNESVHGTTLEISGGIISKGLAK
ncbi:MAG: hypothetical protein RLY16_1671 [Bacteroidota bacterium]